MDYNWLMEYKKTYRPMKAQTNESKKLREGEFVVLTVEISELQIREKQHPEDESQIRIELDALNERQLEVMDVMVEIQEHILGKYETLLALKKERKSLLASQKSLENELRLREEKLNNKICNMLNIR